MLTARRAQQVGLQQRDVAQNLLVSLSGSFQTAPTFWLNRENGVTYNVAVQTPEYRVDSLQALMNTPITAPGAPAPQMLGNLATVTPAVTPAVISHYNIQPVIDVYANVQGRDLGGVARDTRKIVAASSRRSFPAGRALTIRGQVRDHEQLLRRAGVWAGHVDCAGLSADRGQFSIMA